MRIELVQATDNPIELISTIASICYGKEEAIYPLKLVNSLFKSGHHSVFEHVYYTFKIEGISRVCLAQLTRHRHASFTVRSQRYCNESDMDYIIPNNILNNKLLNKAYEDTIAIAYQTYDYLIDCGVKKEDARFILPEANTTELYISLNLRELIHINELRTSKSAQWEIRDLVSKMVEAVLIISPDLEFMFEREVK